MKAQIVPHGNKDADKDIVRKDCSAAGMLIVRIIAFLAVLFGFVVGAADIKGAYMQSGPAPRSIYVRPPRALKSRRRTLWRMLLLPYGISDAGRQWATTVETWMIDTYGLTRIAGIEQLYVLREGSCIKLIVGKATDDFLVAGKSADVEAFFSALGQRFEVGKQTIGGTFRFNGGEIVDRSDGIQLSMQSYTDRLSTLQITPNRRKEADGRCTSAEVTAYRSLAGTLIFLGHTCVPYAALIASRMQQALGDLRVKHLVLANEMVKMMMDNNQVILYRRPKEVKKVQLVTLSDASHGGGGNIYGQSGSITGLVMDAQENGTPLFFPIDWSSHKQKRVSYSAFGAEILAAADADDRGFSIKTILGSILPEWRIRHKLLVDSRGLFDTVTTTHDAREYRLRKTVSRMRDSFECGDLDEVKWIRGVDNLADGLTKVNYEMWTEIAAVFAQGLWLLGNV